MKNNSILILVIFIIWSFCLFYACYLFFDSKLNNLVNMIEIHAFSGYYISCMEENKNKASCEIRANNYVKEIFEK